MKRAEFIKLAGATTGALIAGIMPKENKGVPILPDGIKMCKVEFKPKEEFTKAFKEEKIIEFGLFNDNMDCTMIQRVLFT